MDILELDLPEFWACALKYGDTSDFTDDDEKALDAFTADMLAKYGSCWCIGVAERDGGDFRKYHDAQPFGVLACDVVVFKFDITERGNPDAPVA